MNTSGYVAVLLLTALLAPCAWAACIDAAIETAYLQGNVAALERQVSALAAKANRRQNDDLLLGLAAYRLADLKLLKKDKGGAKDALAEAADALEDRLEKGRDAELGALLGLIYGMQIRISPMKGMWIGDDADEVLEQAMAADPNNPRPQLAYGLNLLYKPKRFGGGADKAVTRLQRAVDLYAKSGADGTCWGGDDATLALARAKLALGNRVAAIALVEEVLTRTPHHPPARRLMAAMRRNAAKGGPVK